MAWVNRGSLCATVTISREPDLSGNFVCDGAADDVEIQAALAYVIALGGGKVLLKYGDYSTDATIFIRAADDIDFVGEGWGTKIIPTGDFCIIQIGDRVVAGNASQTIYVGHIYLDGSAQAYNPTPTENPVDGVGIAIDSPDGETYDITIDQVYLHNTGCDAIYGINAGDTVIHRCITDSCRPVYADIHAHNPQGNWGVYHCKCRGGAGEGIRHGSEIIGNYVTGKEITVDAAIVSGNTVMGNVIEDLTGTAPVGIEAFGDHCTIVGNVITYNSAYQAIIVRPNISNVVIANNLIDTCYREGIFVPAGCSHVIIDGNQIASAGREAIVVEGADEITIVNNDINATSYNNSGIELRTVNSDHPENCLIADNTIEGATAHGINLDGANNCVVDGNRIIAATLFGINITVGSTSNHITSSNVITGCGSGCINELGTNTQLPTVKGDFTYWGGGSEGYTIGPPSGIDIDADGEIAVAHIHLPNDVQEVVRIVFWAYSNLAEAANNMLLELLVNAGGSGEAHNTHVINVASHPSEETGGIAVADVIHWSIDRSDDADIDAILGCDYLEIQAIGEAVADPDIATDALFGAWEIQYV